MLPVPRFQSPHLRSVRWQPMQPVLFSGTSTCGTGRAECLQSYWHPTKNGCTTACRIAAFTTKNALKLSSWDQLYIYIYQKASNHWSGFWRNLKIRFSSVHLQGLGKPSDLHGATRPTKQKLAIHLLTGAKRGPILQTTYPSRIPGIAVHHTHMYSYVSLVFLGFSTTSICNRQYLCKHFQGASRSLSAQCANLFPWRSFPKIISTCRWVEIGGPTDTQNYWYFCVEP